MFKKILSVTLSLVIIFSVFAVDFSVANAEETLKNETFFDRVRDDYDLVWSDEFNDDVLDLTKWTYDVDCRRNSELQYYTGVEGDNLQFDGENAVIVPQVEEYVASDGRKFKYTSAEISTQGRQAWKYGYFEIRAKLSCGQNVVPAIWMMGYDYSTGGCDWPYSGEIDIMERLTHDKAIESKLHHSPYGQKTHKVTSIGGQSFDHKINEEFHNYWLYWTDKYMIVGVDDQMNRIVDITTPELSQSFRTYDHWLLLNVALGMFAKPVNEAEEDQWKMWIDYVRVYQLTDDTLYDNYQAFHCMDLKHNGADQGGSRGAATYKGESNLTFTMQDELTPGKYDVYTEIDNNKAGIDAYINNVKTSEIKAVDHGKAVGNQAYVGSVDLQDKSMFDITFKAKDGSSVTAEKLIFIKTDNNKTTPIVVNKEQCSDVSNYYEVSNETQLHTAASKILPGGTIKLQSDINLTKTIPFFEGCTVDLNDHKITVKGGKLVVTSDEITVQNGKVLVPNGSNNFIFTSSNYHEAKAKLIDVDVTLDASNWGSLFNHDYGSIFPTCYNCTFTHTTNTSNSNIFRIISDNAVFDNCTFNLNGRNAFLMKNNKQLVFNNCVLNDAYNVFYSNSALTSGEIKLSNTTINNLTALSNYTENSSFFSLATNNVLRDANGVEVTDYTNMSGNYTISCNHNFVDASCEMPKHCEYCNLSEGNTLGHNPTTVTTPSDCVYKGSVKSVCTICDETLSEETLPVADHNYVKVQTIEPTCRKTAYHLWECSECGMQQQRSYNGDGKTYHLPHNFDESQVTVVESTCSLRGYTQNHCLVCDRDYKTYNTYLLDHEYTETINADEGYILYDCINCDNSYTLEFDACVHEPLDGASVIVNPTLSNQGYTVNVCKICEQEFKTDFVPALNENLSLDLNTLKGASIRLNDKTGLRFYTEVDQDEVGRLRNLGCTVELGTLIAPKDNLSGKDLTFDLDEGKFVSVKYESKNYYSDTSTGFSGIVGSIVNIKESTASNKDSGNIAREFVARGYAKITDSTGETITIYADYNKEESRSLAFVSYMIKNDSDEFSKDIYAEFVEKIEFWASKYYLDKDPTVDDRW